MEKVCSDSPEEHLQPFKDKMEVFLLTGEELFQIEASVFCQMLHLFKTVLLFTSKMILLHEK